MPWKYAAASVRGTGHVRTGTRLQDAKRCFEISSRQGLVSLIVVISDGAGSANFGGEGASIVCRTLATSAAVTLREAAELPSDQIVWSWVDEIRDRIHLAASKRNQTPRDFAATMILLLATPEGILTAHIGDGAAVGRNRASRGWHVLSSPVHGEYASTTYFVTDDPAPKLRITRYQDDFDAICVFSDGIENLVLDHVSGEASPAFFVPIAKPLDGASESGKNYALSKGLASFLDSDRLNERTDDDKTLIIAVQDEAQ